MKNTILQRNFKKRLTAFSMMILLALIVDGCSGSTGPLWPNPAPTIDSVIIVSASLDSNFNLVLDTTRYHSAIVFDHSGNLTFSSGAFSLTNAPRSPGTAAFGGSWVPGILWGDYDYSGTLTITSATSNSEAGSFYGSPTYDYGPSITGSFYISW